MKGEFLIASFFFAHILDIVTTVVGINYLNLVEMNPLAASHFATLGMERFMVIKVLVATFFIGLYLLTLKRYHRWIWSLETSLKVATVGIWLVVILNTVELIMATSFYL